VIRDAPTYLFSKATYSSLVEAFGPALASKWIHKSGSDATFYIRINNSTPIGVVQLRRLEKLEMPIKNPNSTTRRTKEEKPFLNIDWMFGNSAPGIKRSIEEQKEIFIESLELIMKKALQREEIAGLCIISPMDINENPCCVAVQKIFRQIGMEVHGPPFSVKYCSKKLVRYIRKKQ